MKFLHLATKAIFEMRSNQHNKGQVMILASLALGGTILGATTIAGLLMMYQIRQSIDLANSAKAVFAADSGIEWGLYQLLHPATTYADPAFSNGASVVLTCLDSLGGPLPQGCKDFDVGQIKSSGAASNVSRAFQYIIP